MKRCVLHVGLPKTGTTTIQAFLRQNRERLKEQEVYLPPSRFARCDELFLLSKRKYEQKRIFEIWGIRNQEELNTVKTPLEKEARSWFKTTEGGTIVLSHEGIVGRDQEELENLRDLLADCCDALSVIVTLRRQDLFLNSHFRNRVKNKSEVGTEIRGFGPDYDKILKSLATVFGRENVSPFVFVDSTISKGDLINDFLSACRISVDLTGFVHPEAKNTAWDSRGVRILSTINEILPSMEAGHTKASRKLIEKAIERTFDKNIIPYRMPKERALKVCKIHSGSNARVAREWFGRKELFHNDFSKYDKVVPHPTQEDFSRVIVKLAKVAEAAINAERRKHRKAQDGGQQQ